ncbi:MAG: hypothetical protein QXU45_09755 [Candidatus Bathyarchaeia archaeon]
MSELKPFVTLELRKHKVWNVAVSKQKYGEKFELWPYNCGNKTFFIAIYAKSFFPPRNFKVEGFLIIDENAEVVKDQKFCQRAVRDFFVWRHLYLRPLIKYIPFKERFFMNLKKALQLCLDNCKKRYESNLYKNDDPAKKAYNEILKKLDSDVIQNCSLILKNLEIMAKLMDIEKAIWDRCTCEKIEELNKILIEYKSICIDMANYLAKRGMIFYEYEQAIRNAYKIDLQVSSYSILSKLALSFLLWLANTNFSAIAIPLLPEALKACYQTLAGYKALLKKSKHYLRKTEEVTFLLNLFKTNIEVYKIRNLDLNSF